MITIDIGKDFSRYPYGRYRDDGPYSGQNFREKLLAPALQKHAKVIVILDTASGMGSSFLEEAFGGLVREGFDKNDLTTRLELQSKDATRINQIRGYISGA